ncbi:hypothetical protein [Nakamurella sp.]|uniref:hypothetical protein n=1 Tax=Nakamurella sp. TaxID=1869182 RepID=UPI00378326AD
MTDTVRHHPEAATDVTNLPPFVDGRCLRRRVIHLPSVVSPNGSVISVKCAVDGAAGTPDTRLGRLTAAFDPPLPSAVFALCSGPPNGPVKAQNYGRWRVPAHPRALMLMKFVAFHDRYMN